MRCFETVVVKMWREITIGKSLQKFLTFVTTRGIELITVAARVHRC